MSTATPDVVAGRRERPGAWARLRRGLDRASLYLPIILTGALAQAEERLAMLSTRAVTTVEQATVTCLRVNLFTTIDRCDRAVEVGLDYLRQQGIDWSPHLAKEELRREYERIWSQLGGR